jgi:hypothetical protein
MPAAIFFVRLDLEKNTGIYLPSVKNYLISGQTLSVFSASPLLKATIFLKWKKRSVSISENSMTIPSFSARTTLMPS